MNRSLLFGLAPVALAACSGNAYAQDLQVWWKLDETSGTTASDSSTYGNDGTITGNPVWQSSGGQIDGALDFDGTGDQVDDIDAENYLNGLTALTVSVWVKSDVTNVDKGILVTKDPAGSDNLLAMRYDKVGSNGGNAEVIKFSIGTSSGTKRYESSASVQTTSWQYLAITWSSGETPKLYIDATLNTLSSDEGSIGGSITGVTKLLVAIGVKRAVWDGRIDDFRIYDRALSAAEITTLFQGSGGSVSHHWDFDETSGTTAVTVAAWVNVTSFGVAEQAIVTKGDTAWRMERNASTNTVQFTVDGQDR